MAYLSLTIQWKFLQIQIVLVEMLFLLCKKLYGELYCDRLHLKVIVTSR